MNLRDLVLLLKSGKDVTDIPMSFGDNMPTGIIFNIGDLEGDKLLKTALGLMPQYKDIQVVRPFKDEEGFEWVEDENVEEEPVVEMTDPDDPDEDEDEIPIEEFNRTFTGTDGAPVGEGVTTVDTTDAVNGDSDTGELIDDELSEDPA